MGAVVLAGGLWLDLPSARRHPLMQGEHSEEPGSRAWPMHDRALLLLVDRARMSATASLLLK